MRQRKARWLDLSVVALTARCLICWRKLTKKSSESKFRIANHRFDSEFRCFHHTHNSLCVCLVKTPIVTTFHFSDQIYTCDGSRSCLLAFSLAIYGTQGNVLTSGINPTDRLQIESKKHLEHRLPPQIDVHSRQLLRRSQECSDRRFCCAGPRRLPWFFAF